MKGLRTKKVNTIKEGTLIVAVDIGMVSNHGCCTTADGRSTKTFRFDNTREGLETLWNMVLASKTRFQCTEVIIGYESTGPYGEPLIHYLKQKPVTIVQVNPLHTKRMREINDNSPLKTDRKDPRVIADVIRIGHALSVVVPEGETVSRIFRTFILVPSNLVFPFPKLLPVPWLAPRSDPSSGIA